MSPSVAAALKSAFFVGGLALLFHLETKHAYRTPTVSRTRRGVINISLSLINSVVLAYLFGALLLATTAYVTSRNIGLMNLVGLPEWLKVIVFVVVMDFLLYVWHLLNHEMPLMWRFHRVHHADLNMDVTTATRFHIGELAISAIIKISLVYLLGASLTAVLVFETLLVAAAQFQHSSVRVSEAFERRWWTLFVPPSMHRIHHSVKIRERDTNYGTIFSLWDRVCGTLLTDVDQDGIRIGVGAYRKPEKLNLHHLFMMPFTRPIR